MSDESDYWKVVRDNLGPFGMLVRVENGIGLGTPDVAYALKAFRPVMCAAPEGSGWIELKKIDAFPSKPSTILRVPKLTKEQADFLRDWSIAGGRAWLLLRAPPWHLLFDAAGARGVYDQTVTAGDAPGVAKAASTGTFPTGKVLRALTS